MPEIFILSGPDLGRSYRVGAGAVLGRDASCAVTLRERSVSRRHAKLECEEGLWILVDLKSRNGCFIDDIRVERARLKDGQGFRLGEQQLRFREQETEGAVLMDAPAPAAMPAESESGDGDDEDIIDEEVEFDLDAPATAYPDASSPGQAGGGIEVEFGDEIDLGDEVHESPPPSDEAPSASEGLTFAAGGGVGAAPKPQPKPRAPSAPKKAPRAKATPGQERLARERASLAATSVTNRSASVGGVAVREGSDRVLQYNRKVDTGGFMAADLTQYPAWVRYLAYALVLAVAVAVAYFSFQGAGILKRSGTTEILEEE